ncbi:MAG TPA: hypothetical protein VMW65_09685, partial [Chloroflexota bacterium]|nr:hypothetical protein [Chloroflexota bacterium]
RLRGMIRAGHWKLSYSHGDPPELELYDLENDLGEFTNLADRPEVQVIQANLLARLLQHWDPNEITARILQSQRERKVIRGAQVGMRPTF